MAAAQMQAPTATRAAVVDPTTLSVVWNRFEHILAEIGDKALYATQSFVMANVRDLGQSLLDPRGDIVAVAAYVPIHVFTAEVSVKSFLQKFEGDFHPGDFFLGNDAYIIRSGHLPDWTLLRPIFYEDELFGFFQFRGHMADTGGFLPGGYAPGAYDIIAEGLNIPPIRIIKEGVLDEELWGLVKRNIRNSDVVEMDVFNVNGAMAQGEAELSRLLDKYGIETVKQCMEEMLASGERAARAQIATMRDGVYYGESGTDWDGQTDKPVNVQVKLTIEGDEMTFDLSESDPQCSFINLPWGTTVYSCMEAVYSMLDPHVPKNSGSMRPVHVVAKEGTVVNPTYPATVGASQITISVPLVDACWEALAQLLPERAMGGYCRHHCPINIGMDPRVIDPRTGTVKQYFGETFASDGSGGAMSGFDGWQGVGNYRFVGCMVRPDMEVFETQIPYRVMRYELLQDWEGAGEYRGGPGVYLEMVCNEDLPPDAATLLQTGNSDGMRFAPKGVAGGGDGRLNEMWIGNPLSGERRRLPTMSLEHVAPGEIVYHWSSGGGGWGDPLSRALASVREDVIEGLVSLTRARDVYGVVVDEATMEVDEQATEVLRKDIKAKRTL